MGNGYLRIKVTTGNSALPIADSSVTVINYDGRVLYKSTTNVNGFTIDFELKAPDMEYTLDCQYMKPAYSVYDVEVKAVGFVTKIIHELEIIDTQTTILPVHMQPLVDEINPITLQEVYIPPVGLIVQAPYLKIEGAAHTPDYVLIPEYITVHLGLPNDASAANVHVHFTEYVKNVASSEIYPTWPYNSMVANIHAIITFALNRVFTEWYRSRNYNFDITNSTSYDQYFKYEGHIYENISMIVDEIFNIFAHRFAFINPFFTAFCNGTTSTCPGLSQWGTVTLANQGKSELEILRYYYPRDLQLTASNNIAGITESYPGYTLQLGSQGEPVRRMQNSLNRIRVNYPLIPVIPSPNGEFGVDTQSAVRTFQRTFDLPVDGIIGRAVWNKISAIFVSVTRLGELDSEGIRYTIGEIPPNVTLSLGSRGENVLELEFILNFISEFYETIPFIIMDGVFDNSNKNAVIEFQKAFSIYPQEGIVGPVTWNKLYAVYRGINENVVIPDVNNE